MDDAKIPNFESAEEESIYWKEKALQLQEKVEELEQELIDFQENSSQLEKELEKSLEHADRANRDLRTKCNRLTLELDMCREKYEQHCLQSSKQIADLQKEISDYRQNEEKLTKHIRELEQKNDDLERSERVMIESVGNIEAKLNCAIERNALLENELDEKEMLRAMVQRLKDEQRDMQQELSRQKRHSMPDNDKYMECVRSPVDSNKLSLESQTTPSSIKSKKERSYERITCTRSCGSSRSVMTVVSKEYTRTKITFESPNEGADSSNRSCRKTANILSQYEPVNRGGKGFLRRRKKLVEKNSYVTETKTTGGTGGDGKENVCLIKYKTKTRRKDDSKKGDLFSFFRS